MKRFVGISVLLLLICMMSAVSASAFTLNYSGPIKFKFSNWEMLNEASSIPYYDNNGDGMTDNYGIFDITQIIADDGTNTVLWNKGDAGEYLVGTFFDIDYQSITPEGAGLNVQSVRGQFDMYLATAATFDANLGSGGYYDTDLIDYNEYQGITDQGYAAFASMLLVPGVDPLTDATLDGDFDGSTLPSSGDAQFYGSIIPGSGIYADLLDNNGYALTYTDDVLGAGTPMVADVYGINDYFNNDGSIMPEQGDWDLVSEDPIRASVSPIPEPSTMLLVGTGLFGLANLCRRRFGRK